MAAQTIAAQVGELVGTASGIASLDDWAGDAINKLYGILPYEELAPYSTLETETYDATAITAKNKRIFEVFRKPTAGSAVNRRCRYIYPQEYVGPYADSNSMLAPTDWDPVWTTYNDEIVVLPTVSGMVISARRISLISPATFDTTGTAISVLPEKAEYLVVLDLAKRVAFSKAQALASVNADFTTKMTATTGQVDVALAAEDIELAQGWLSKTNEWLKKYQLDIVALEKYLLQGASFNQEYYQQLYERFGIDLRPRPARNEG